jgi:hypothetical protein
MTTPVKIKRKEAKAILKRLAAERPHYVYDRREGEDGQCSYFKPDGSPSCIVGHLLAVKGVTKADLDADNTGTGVADLPRCGIIKATPRTIKMLEDVQEAQDKGTRWGKAVKTVFLLDQAAHDEKEIE